MKTIGKLSDGIRLCYQEGLTSGKMLDYVYKNQPSGKWGVGRLMDKRFLDDPGWAAVRTRRKNLETLIMKAIGALKGQKRAVSLVDIASGPGAYIMSVLEQAGEDGITARCRDFEKRWVDEGNRTARMRNLKNIRFEQGDAFDREGFLALEPRPNLAVASGFYDWFNEDEKVKRSIRIVFDTLERGGYFVLSNQCGHPNLEFTEQVFTDFTKNPLRMTMRPKETIHSFLSEAGFEAQETLQDDKQYYSVTLAKKI
jgi:SAM-dependent methyltransferase